MTRPARAGWPRVGLAGDGAVSAGTNTFTGCPLISVQGTLIIG
jgi:hypothetical protein